MRNGSLKGHHDAGAAAGRRWAAKNESRLERLRTWWSSRPIDAVDRFAIYATCLTDRYMVGTPADFGGAQQFSIPMFKAERLANAYWCRLTDWPRRGAERQRLFLDGFVRGAIGARKSP